MRKHFADWSALRAWGRDLSEVRVEYIDREYPDRAGTCWSRQQRIKLYRSRRVSSMLATLLHELAHAVEIEDDHGPRWQARFASAVAEVTSARMPEYSEPYSLLDRAAEDAIAAWWLRIGGKLIEGAL